jgi:anti-sigma-K factor RskA
MTPQAIDELMLLYVMGVADDEQAGRAEALLAMGDPAAHAAHAEAMTVIHAIPQALQLQMPSTRVRDQLLLRAIGSTQAIPANVSQASQTATRSKWPIWISTAAAAGFAIVASVLFVQNQRVEGELAMQLVEAQETNRVVGSPHVKMAKLELVPEVERGNAAGKIVFCPVSNQYQLRVFRLSAPPLGRVYELWLIDERNVPVPAGTFAVNDRGMATHYYKVPAGISFVKAAITDEPVGGSPKPTGAIHLAGKL